MFKVSELIKATKGKLLCGNCNAGIKSISIDSRTLKRGDCFIAIKGDNFDGHDFIQQAIKKGAGCIIKDKRPTNYELRTTNCIIVNDTTKALGDIAGFWRNKFDIPVIAVTGSNGKTTTKDMIAHVLSAKFKVLKNEGTKNNHIGLPMALLGLKPAHEMAVLEIGTNHFGEVANLAQVCGPNIGVITNVGPSHLEYLLNLNGVLCEKYSLFTELRSPGIGILNADDYLLRSKLSKRGQRTFNIGLSVNGAADFSASCLSRSKKGVSFLVGDKNKFSLSTPGYYNIHNALAAIAIGRILGLGHKDISRRLANFKFPHGRLNFVTVGGVRFIDDTYNANPASLARALDVLAEFRSDGRRIVVMGDMMELGVDKEKFHLEAGRQITKACDILITVGELSAIAAREASSMGFDADNIFKCVDAPQARRILFDKLSPGPKDIVLVKGSRAMKMEEVLKIGS